jgi:CubicO group peptidase (beta-lactamase class C family)
MFDLSKTNRSGRRMSRRRFLQASLGAGLAASVGAARAQAHPGGVQGLLRPGFEPVRDVIAASLANGGDIGCSTAVFIDGEPVVDIWGGYYDPERTRIWEHDTIVNTFSSTKTMTGGALLAEIWPSRKSRRQGSALAQPYVRTCGLD